MTRTNLSLSFTGLPFASRSPSRKSASMPSISMNDCKASPSSQNADDKVIENIEKVDVPSVAPKTGCKVVPDSRNWVKYLRGQSSNPTLPRPSAILPDGPRAIVFNFGVVADVQYARLPTARGVKTITDNGKLVHVRRRRAWREAFGKLEEAMRAFDKADVGFVVNLGDAIEGYEKKEEMRSTRDLKKVCEVFERAQSNVYHVVGNHCRRVRQLQLKKVLGLSEFYYAFCPSDGWRFVVLYSAELCGGAVDAADEEDELLKAIVKREGRTMHHFHAALGDGQLRWLEAQLDQAEEEKERVVLFSHHPLADDSARSSHVLANTKQVKQIVERKETPVVLCLAGHDHMGELVTFCCCTISVLDTFWKLTVLCSLSLAMIQGEC